MNLIPSMLVALSLATATATASTDHALSLAWETDQFQGPESVVYDKRTGLLFVSNVNGEPTEKNGQGFISTVKLDGSIAQLKWVEGLNAPKGVTVVDHTLYVADIDQFLEIDIDTGQVIKRHQAPDAKFLNDVVADAQGNVYVSDMLTNTIYRLSEGKFTPWLQSDALEFPNGLFVQGDELIVGSWGVMTNGFDTEVPGHLKTVSLSNQAINTLGSGQPVGNLDGVEPDGQGNFYVTDWISGGLMLIDRQGSATQLLPLAKGSADHEVVEDSNLIIIPMMLDHKLLAYKTK